MAANPSLKMAIFNSPWTQTVVAGRAGIEESRLSRIIHGHAEATDDEQKQLAKILRKPIAELFPESVAS